MPMKIGTRVGSFEITSLLGRGGYGEVYRARDESLKRNVAIKILPEQFQIDVLRCEQCGGRLKIIAAIHPPDTTQKLLRCMGLPLRAHRSPRPVRTAFISIFRPAEDSCCFKTQRPSGFPAIPPVSRFSPA
jgi:serine/threonine protein kinase